MGSADGTGGYSADSYDTGARLTINPVIQGTGAARNSVAMQVCMNAGKERLKRRARVLALGQGRCPWVPRQSGDRTQHSDWVNKPIAGTVVRFPSGVEKEERGESQGIW